MKTISTFAVAAGLALIVALPGTVRSQDVAAPDVAQGERDYHETGCYACHGTVGHGGAWQGPKLSPDPLPYPLFLRQLRQPLRTMPRYSETVLSDAEVANIYAWLKTVRAGSLRTISTCSTTRNPVLYQTDRPFLDGLVEVDRNKKTCWGKS